MLHYSHEDFQGGHQGINRTFERLRSEFYCIGMYADVQKFVRECVDCASAKGRPPVLGPSPGNIEQRYPFEVVSLDFVTELPESDRGNTYLLLFQDQFSGYVMCKPMRNTEAQDVAEAYEECVLRRFGASSMIRHDQDPRFMSKVFARFRDLLKSKQRTTLGYRPQANGQQERSVQTVMRSVRAYVAEVDQGDWDENAEHLVFALNTSFDAARLDTPFYLVHGWDAQGTISAMLGPKPSTVQERTALEWPGDSVWLYIPKVRTGLSRKLAHLWHGPFRIDEIHDDFRVKFKIPGTGYRVIPWVHIRRLKPRALFPKRPTSEIQVSEDDDFDAALLPEDSWEPDAAQDEYEVEAILDLSGKTTQIQSGYL
ncbi:reverse transcriptase [Phytophthora megakarya]|uniref:Reverse transcriptase n=1 Tax=Phytophthora megakarya TaxID=4795 RepID=A0A225VAW8_9STRA|nr:reverse transcriptase [Phytophthora megakarya]